jgi:hypothetical protein
MSKNRNRAKLNKAKTGKAYQRIQMRYEYDYCYICMRRSGSYYYDCHPSPTYGRHGDGRALYARGKRMHRTWKHNRKTQWK